MDKNSTLLLIFMATAAKKISSHMDQIFKTEINNFIKQDYYPKFSTQNHLSSSTVHVHLNSKNINSTQHVLFFLIL